MTDLDGNPLASPQRETVGAETFSKYEYQYHWALCRMLTEHEKGGEYVVFVEFHEDVVVGDSLDADQVKFEFNQVKDYSSISSVTLNKLLSSKKDSDSILVKMLKSVSGKQFVDDVTVINLVATCGFSIPLKKDDLKLELITIGDLSEDSLEKISDHVESANIDSGLSDKVQFLVPDLANKGMQDAVVGRIASLVDSLFPGCQSSPVYIYRAVLDELHRKGMVQYDYAKWGDVVSRKGLSSTTVAEVIARHASDKNKDDIKSEYQVLSSELNLNYQAKKDLWKSVERYYTRSLAARDPSQMLVDKQVSESVGRGLAENFANTNDLVQYIEADIPADIKKIIGADDAVRGAVLCKIIMS